MLAPATERRYGVAVRLRRVRGWYGVEQHEDADWAKAVLPVSDAQSCAVCGSDDWSWLYPLTLKTRGAIACGPFWAACDGCQKALETGWNEAIIARHASITSEDAEWFAEDALPAFHAARLGAPLTRAAAQKRG